VNGATESKPRVAAAAVVVVPRNWRRLIARRDCVGVTTLDQDLPEIIFIRAKAVV
jgi:hypothetical protein